MAVPVRVSPSKGGCARWVLTFWYAFRKFFLAPSVAHSYRISPVW
jgi:hypothetical protein